MNRTIIEVRGGVIQSVKSTDLDMVFEVVDYDCGPNGESFIMKHPETAMDKFDDKLPERILVSWHVEDVIMAAENMGENITKEEAKEILQEVNRRYDATIGINWDVVRDAIDDFLALRKREVVNHGSL